MFLLTVVRYGTTELTDKVTESKVCPCGLMETAPAFIALSQDDLSVCTYDVHEALTLCF